MLSTLLQHPQARQTIWANLEKMMELRGYRWIVNTIIPPRDHVKGSPLAKEVAPLEKEGLIPDKYGFLRWYHKHAVKDSCEDVYVAFYAKLTGPSTSKLQHRSRHVIFVADSVTSPALTALNIRSTSGTSSSSSSSTAVAVVASNRTLDTRELKLSRTLMMNFMDQYYLQHLNVQPLTVSQASAVEIERQTERTKFPRLLMRDALVRFFALQPGTLVRFTRLSPTAGLSIVERYVVPTTTTTTTTTAAAVTTSALANVSVPNPTITASR